MTNEKITEKSTKGTIFKAYQAAMEQIEALKSAQLNPTEIAASKKKEEVLKQATNTTKSSVDSVVENLRKVVDTALTELTVKFEDKTAQFNNLDEAIKLKDAELKEIYDIERQANTLAALINSHDVLKKEQSAENEAALKAYQEKLAEIRKLIQDADKEYNAKLNEQRAELAKEQKRAKAEWEYDFARTKKQAEDELADDITAAKKEIADEVAKLDAREEAVSTREKAVEELESKVAEIPALVEAAAKEAADKAKKDAEKSFVFEKRAIEANKDAEIKVLQHQVELLTNALETEKENHKKTSEQLNEAYGRLENVATASVEGQKAQDTITKLLSTVGEKSSK